MRVIFLDIDGVLNCMNSKTTYKGVKGIDDEFTQRLWRIESAFDDCVIVLTSTWRDDWFRTQYIEDLNPYGQYLVKSLHKYSLHIFDKTIDDCWKDRGQGIKNWIRDHSDLNIDKYIIIDDEMFDYVEQDLCEHLIKTSFYGDDGGLQDLHVEKAIELLK